MNGNNIMVTMLLRSLGKDAEGVPTEAALVDLMRRIAEGVADWPLDRRVLLFHRIMDAAFARWRVLGGK